MVYERTLLRSNTRLVMHRLTLVSVVVGSLTKRMAARHRPRRILCRVLAGELALHVA